VLRHSSDHQVDPLNPHVGRSFLRQHSTLVLNIIVPSSCTWQRLTSYIGKATHCPFPIFHSAPSCEAHFRSRATRSILPRLRILGARPCTIILGTHCLVLLLCCVPKYQLGGHTPSFYSAASSLGDPFPPFILLRTGFPPPFILLRTEVPAWGTHPSAVPSHKSFQSCLQCWYFPSNRRAYVFQRCLQFCLSHTVDLGIGEFSLWQGHCHLFQIIANRGVLSFKVQPCTVQPCTLTPTVAFSISVSNRALCNRAL